MIDGSLVVSGTGIIHVEPLQRLAEVTGSVGIERNPQLVNLDGFFSLRSVGKSLDVKGSTGLRSLTELYKVRTVSDRLVVFRNSQLETLRALRRLQSVGEAIYIRENTVLSDSVITVFRDTMIVHGFRGQFTSIDNGR